VTPAYAKASAGLPHLNRTPVRLWRNSGIVTPAYAKASAGLPHLNRTPVRLWRNSGIVKLRIMKFFNCAFYF